MSKFTFEERAWDDYLYWQKQDKRVLKKINQILKDIERDNFNGIGKPEPLRGDLSGYWSRRIDEVNRIVYKIQGELIVISACLGHYE